MYPVSCSLSHYTETLRHRTLRHVIASLFPSWPLLGAAILILLEAQLLVDICWYYKWVTSRLHYQWPPLTCSLSLGNKNQHGPVRYACVSVNVYVRLKNMFCNTTNYISAMLLTHSVSETFFSSLIDNLNYIQVVGYSRRSHGSSVLWFW